MGECEIGSSRFNSACVIFGDVRGVPRAVVSHEQRTAVHGEIRTEFSHGSLVDLATIQRTTYRLRNAMRHSLALGLLREVSLAFAQCFFRVFAFGQITTDSLHADRFAIAED